MIRGQSGLTYTYAADGSAFHERRIKYHPFFSQNLFDRCPAKFKGFSGPIGSGKSKALVYEAIKLSYLNPGCQGLLAAPTYRLLEDATAQELLATLEEHGIPHRFHKSAFTIEILESGATILMRSMEEPERLRALNLGWFGVDELTYCKPASWKRLCGRLRHPKAQHQRGFAAWTPKGRDWVWEMFVSTRKVENYACIQARPFENRVVLDVNRDYYENLRQSYDEKFFRQEVLGEYLDMFGGTVYHAFGMENVRPCDFNPALPLVWTLDFNVDRMSMLVCQQEMHYRRAQVQVLQEIVLLSDAHAAAAAAEFVRRIQPWAEARRRPLEVHVYGDATGGNRSVTSATSAWTVLRQYMATLQDLVRCRFQYGRKNPEVADRVNAVNAMLCTFGDGHQRAGDRRLYIDPSCRELLEDLERVRWKVDAHGNSYPELDKSDAKRTHTSDALGYYLWEAHGFAGRARAIPDSIL
jgi:hypothetical protein